MLLRLLGRHNRMGGPPQFGAKPLSKCCLASTIFWIIVSCFIADTGCGHQEPQARASQQTMNLVQAKHQDQSVFEWPGDGRFINLDLELGTCRVYSFTGIPRGMGYDVTIKLQGIWPGKDSPRRFLPYVNVTLYNSKGEPIGASVVEEAISPLAPYMVDKASETIEIKPGEIPVLVGLDSEKPY